MHYPDSNPGFQGQFLLAMRAMYWEFLLKAPFFQDRWEQLAPNYAPEVLESLSQTQIFLMSRSETEAGGFRIPFLGWAEEKAQTPQGLAELIEIWEKSGASPLVVDRLKWAFTEDAFDPEVQAFRCELTFHWFAITSREIPLKLIASEIETFGVLLFATRKDGGVCTEMVKMANQTLIKETADPAIQIAMTMGFVGETCLLRLQPFLTHVAGAPHLAKPPAVLKELKRSPPTAEESTTMTDEDCNTRHLEMTLASLFLNPREMNEFVQQSQEKHWMERREAMGKTADEGIQQALEQMNEHPPEDDEDEGPPLDGEDMAPV